MIISIDAFCVDEAKNIDLKKAIPIDVKPCPGHLKDTHCILVMPDMGELVVNREQMANAVQSIV